MALNRNIVALATTTMANGATVTATSVNGEYANGFRAVFIQLTGSGNVTITEQGSLDGLVFYDVVDGSGAALGAVCSALTSTAGVYVQYNPVFARHARLKIVAGAASTVAITITSSEQTP